MLEVELGEALEERPFLSFGAGRREANLSELYLSLLEQGHCVPCTTPGTVGPLGLEVKGRMYPTHGEVFHREKRRVPLSQFSDMELHKVITASF